MKTINLSLLGNPANKSGFGDAVSYDLFCAEQPTLIAFLTRYGRKFQARKTWTTLTLRLAHTTWAHYRANNVKVPEVSLEVLERHYTANKEFVDTLGAPARDTSFEELKNVCKTRQQAVLRIFMLASLFDFTQDPMIGPDDKREAPKLVRNQNHAQALLGAVLEAFEEVGIEQEENTKE